MFLNKFNLKLSGKQYCVVASVVGELLWKRDGSGSEWFQQPVMSVMEVEVVPGIKTSSVTSQFRLWTPVA